MPGPSFFGNLGLFVVRGFFDSGSCRQLAEEFSRAAAHKGTVIRDGQEGVLDEKSRKVDWIDVEDSIRDDVTQRFKSLKPQLETHFQVSLSGCEPISFLRYEPGAFYRPHRDASQKGTSYSQKRRVSVVAFLNQPAESNAGEGYGGGSLAFYGLIKEPAWEKCAFDLVAEPGLLVAFPSDMLHEVKPVTSGHRLSVVSWFFTEPDSAAT